MRWYTTDMTKRGTPEEWYWQKVRKGDGCWEWTGAHSPAGYGLHRFHGVQRSTHRISWEMHVGPIPDGLFVLHKCDNPPCVNPAHLWLGTQADNVHDAFAKGRRHTPTVSPERRARGSRGGTAKLTEPIVATIRRRLEAGEPCTALAREFGVSASTVEHIKHRTVWQHVG